jgi:hypothetical protein
MVLLAATSMNVLLITVAAKFCATILQDHTNADVLKETASTKMEKHADPTHATQITVVANNFVLSMVKASSAPALPDSKRSTVHVLISTNALSTTEVAHTTAPTSMDHTSAGAHQALLWTQT